MQITCPSCAAEYVVADASIAGRMVRCAHCGEQWTPVPIVSPLRAPPRPAPPPPPAMAYETVVPPAPIPAPAAAPAIEAAPPRRDWALIGAWMASAVVLAAVAIWALVNRDGIMEAWPPSQRLFGAFGLR